MDLGKRNQDQTSISFKDQNSLQQKNGNYNNEEIKIQNDSDRFESREIKLEQQNKKKSLNQITTIRDPVHGHIELPYYLIQIINTRQFQRLRYLHQLGVAYYVFPTGNHKRFEHCIGTAYLALGVVKTLRQQQIQDGVRIEDQINDRDEQCVAIAGLCHDLGHGPFSHLFDGPFLSEILPQNHKWSHEWASTILFNQILEENPDIIIKKDSKEAEFIKSLIEGNFHECPDEKQYLFEIVNNEKNSIDVDKIDYIQRDCRNINLPYISFNNQILVKHMKIINNEICYPEKYSQEIQKLFKSRWNLHRDCYNHKTIQAYELMVVDILLECHNVLYDFSKVILDPNAYIKLDDTIIEEIRCSDDPKLEKAKELIERMDNRQQYYCVGEKGLKESKVQLYWDKINKEEIIKFKRDGDSIISDDIQVKKFNIHFGMKEKHPLNHVKFYDNKNLDDGSFELNKRTLKSMLPNQNQYWMVRCFCKSLDKQKQQQAVDAFREYCSQILGGESRQVKKEDIYSQSQRISSSFQQQI